MSSSNGQQLWTPTPAARKLGEKRLALSHQAVMFSLYAGFLLLVILIISTLTSVFTVGDANFEIPTGSGLKSLALGAIFAAPLIFISLSYAARASWALVEEYRNLRKEKNSSSPKS